MVHSAASGSIPTATLAAFAAELDGSEYPLSGTPGLWARMQNQGVVAVFGASDDLMEFRGAINDEVGAYDGGTAFVTPTGLLDLAKECCKHARAANKAAKESAVAIDALWCAEPDLSWSYQTAIPHTTFNVMEDGEVYCRGIVFALSDIATLTKGAA